MDTYNKYLKIVEKELGHNTTTTDVELNRYCKAVFGKLFRGVYPLDKIPKLKNNESCIFNLDTSDMPGSHWVGAYKNGKKNIVYDSFGRTSKELNIPLTKYIDTELDAEQHIKEKNCGQRVTAFIACCYTLPIQQVLTI
jgi:hypothetical protein